MKQLTEKQAIAFHDSKAYKNMTHREIAEFQIQQKLLCVPFSIFHEAIEKTLDRPVFTHEFGFNLAGIKQELFLNKKPPTLEEIISMLPSEKVLILEIRDNVKPT